MKIINFKMRKIKNKSTLKRETLIKKIIVWIIITAILGLILTASFGNLDAVRTLWKIP